MTLSFDLGLAAATRRRVAPWWHAYRAPGGALPALVLEGEAGRLQGGAWLNDWTIDLSGLDLSGGFTIFARGSLDYAGGATAFPRLVEFGTEGTSDNRQSLMLQAATGQVRIISRAAGVTGFSAAFATPLVASGAEFATMVRFAPDDFAAHLPGATPVSAASGAVPGGLDRLYLRSAGGGVPEPGAVGLVVLWAASLGEADLAAYAP